jgi:AMP deaminase
VLPHPSYYLSRLGCSISPLSNNTLYRALRDNPFYDLFQRGLNVTLSTDDPMQFHTTAEPLLEEYTMAKQFWQLSSAELSEIAYYSVRQSGFSHRTFELCVGVALLPLSFVRSLPCADVCCVLLRCALAEWKKAALGENYLVPGPAGNDINKTNVPDCRATFRHENLLAEYSVCFAHSFAHALVSNLILFFVRDAVCMARVA